jgi:N-acetylneuraminic acid mutarotase
VGIVPTAELWSYDTVGRVWTLVQATTGTAPDAREGCTLAAVGDKLLLFGGSTSAGLSNELWEFIAGEWKYLNSQISGRLPSPRTQHSAAVVNGSMYVVGGYTGSADKDAEFFIYDAREAGSALVFLNGTRGVFFAQDACDQVEGTSPLTEMCVDAAPCTASVRCVDSSGCTSMCDFVDVTFAEAQAACSAANKRLPFQDELPGCCGTGCTFDASFVWIHSYTGPYLYCADEGSTCTCTGAVRYGNEATGTWAEPKEVYGSTPCSNAEFGDPLAGVPKVCVDAAYTFHLTFPPLTWGHTLLSLGTSIFFLGGVGAVGFTEFYQIKLETTTLEWSNLAEQSSTAVNPTPSARKYHSMASLGNTFYLFGGVSTLSDELWSSDSTGVNFNLLSSARRGLWGPLLPGKSSASPEARQLHAMTSAGDRILLLHGGRTRGGLSNEMWQYDSQAGEWYLNSGFSGNQPSAREGHAMTAVNLTVYLFGGNTAEDSTMVSDELFAYSIPDGVWTSLNNASIGTFPGARQNHRMTSIAHTLYLFMGRTKSGLTADLYSYNTNTRQWRDLPLSPAARESFALAAVGTQILLHGGLLGYDPSGDAIMSSELWQLNTLTLRWKLLPTLGNLVAREGHAMCSVGTRIYMFGGETASGEAYILRPVRDCMVWIRQSLCESCSLKKTLLSLQ